MPDTDDRAPAEYAGEPLQPGTIPSDQWPRGDLFEQMREFMEGAHRPELINVADPVSGVVVPATLDAAGVRAISATVFEDYLPGPRFRRGTATMTCLSSFIDHVNRYRADSSAVFAIDDRSDPSLLAVLDYSPAGADSQPHHGKHRTAFKFPLSDEWKAWHGKNGHKMNMVDFAAFLEDHIVDVDIPEAAVSEDAEKLIQTLGGRERIASPTALMELSRGLTVHESSVISQSTKLSSGEGNITFQSEHTDASGQQLRVPTMFLLSIPVFRNGELYRVLGRLRYRAVNGVLTFWYELSRTDRVFDHAFDEAVERVAEETSAPVFRGKPEA